MRGGDTGRLRSYNERLVVSAVLRAGALSKAEIARETGLSGQAAAVIVNRLIADDLLIKRDKVRGQVGQPSTPIAANPGGAYSLGIKIGRRSCEAILVNLLGEVIASEREAYHAPFPEDTINAAIGHARNLLGQLDSKARGKVVGLGIAIPGELHSWGDELDLAPGVLDGWRDADVAGIFEEATGLPTTLHNDATAACAAEMIAGQAITTRSALYIYLGTFIGGGVVIDGKLYSGEQLNAGAIGSMPTGETRRKRMPEQLIHNGSVIRLERRLVEAGLDPLIALSGGGSERADLVFDTWTEEALPELSRAVVSALSIIDFQRVVIDGILPPQWRDRLAERLRSAIGSYNLSGLAAAEITTGTIGPLARVLGAAMLPLQSRFSPHAGIFQNTGGYERHPSALGSEHRQGAI